MMYQALDVIILYLLTEYAREGAINLKTGKSIGNSNKVDIVPRDTRFKPAPNHYNVAG